METPPCLVEIVGDRIRGLAVHEASRVLNAAPPGAILVSQTTRDLSVASAMTFADQGLFALKGLPGERRLFALVTVPAE